MRVTAALIPYLVCIFGDIFTTHNDSTSWASQGVARAVDWPCPAQYYELGSDFVTLCSLYLTEELWSFSLRGKGVHTSEKPKVRWDTMLPRSQKHIGLTRFYFYVSNQYRGKMESYVTTLFSDTYTTASLPPPSLER